MRNFTPLIIVLLTIAGTCFADTLTINDSQGVVRAEQSVAQGEQSAVQFNVTQTNPDEAAKVLLTNQSTGEVIEVTAHNGTALFENIGPGSWTVSSPTAGVTFTSIQITPIAVAGSLAAAGIPGSVLAIGGVGAVAGTAAIAANANDDSDEPPMSPNS